MSLDEGDNKASSFICTLRKTCYAFQSEDKRARKQALIDLQKLLSDTSIVLTPVELQTIFNEIHIYVFKAFRDKAEAVRSQTIKFMTFFLLEKLPKNDYYITYVFPVLVERIGTVELIEESEEIRLELLLFMQSIILAYTNTGQLKPFLNDCICILCETVKDKHPEVKEISCKCITDLAIALPKDFHLQCESLVKPVLSAFGYQRYKIRVEAVKCIGDIVMHSSYKALEEAVGPMAERLFDPIPAVRQTVADVAARWLLEYRDRYSFFHKLLPLILTGLNDEIPQTRDKSLQLWKKIGYQYTQENETDLKDQMDFLIKPPKYYPEHLERPNLGCRVLVQRNVSKIAPALARELTSWQPDVKVRCSQLLCAIVLHAEDGLTQHLQDLLVSMYSTARDEDPRVVVNVIQAAELIGLFVPVDTYLKLILPAIEDGPHYGHLSILAALVRGAPHEYITPSLEKIGKVVSDNNVCHSRKAKYQQEFVKCVTALLTKMEAGMFVLGEYLFQAIVTIISLRDLQNIDTIRISLLEDLADVLGCASSTEIWSRYMTGLLQKINKDPKGWSSVSVDRCIFETLLLESGEAFGQNLQLIGEILGKTLDTDSDAEARLRTFIALSSTLDAKDTAFKNADGLDEFLQKLLEDVLVPTLVWHAGRTAETMRTMAVSCLCSALNPGVQVELFPSAEAFRPFMEKLVPLLLSLTEDSAFKSRLLAMEALVLLKETAVKKNLWENDEFLKIYPEILKRFDDPTDSVRIGAVKAFTLIIQNPPEDFTTDNFKSHHEFIIDTLLTHFDDDEGTTLLTECLKSMVNVSGKITLTNKINIHKPLLRNQSGCDQIIEAINNVKVSA